jgi:hypothetical protein
MELESTLVVTKFAFSERVVVIEIVVERFTDKILQEILEVMYRYLLENLLDNVNDAALLYWPDSHHHTSRISEPG